MNPVIIKFLEECTVVSLATSRDNTPHTASCFYAFDRQSGSLLIKSDPGTRHVTQALDNPHVAGTILPDALNKAIIKGIQFSGTFSPASARPVAEDWVYYKRYPFARVIPGQLFAIKLSEIRITDQTLGFGKKICWKADEESVAESTLKL